MSLFNFSNIKIAGIASAIPSQTVRVDDFVSEYGEDVVNRFKTMTGIHEYRKTSKYQTASDLGYVAARKIIEDKSIEKESIGACVFVTHSADYRRPATACVLQKRLGLSKDCTAFDVGLGCSAFVYGLQIVCALMQCSDINRAMLIVGETPSKMIYPKDRSASMLFGDAGSAIFLEKTETEQCIKGLLKTDGNGYRAIIAPAGGFRNMNTTSEVFTWADGNERTLYNTYMNGTDVFNFTISDVPDTIKEFLERTNTVVDDYDCFAFHQANKFIHKQLSKKLKIEFEKMPLCLDRYGNTSASAIPLTLCDKYGTCLNLGSNLHVINILACGFGVGLSWGVTSFKMNTTDIYPVTETDEYYSEGLINSPEDM